MLAELLTKADLIQTILPALLTKANLIQAGLLGFSGTAIWLVNSKSTQTKFWGGVIGLLGQPFWIMTFGWKDWGGLLLVVWYTIAYMRGINNNRKFKWKVTKKQRARFLLEHPEAR